jgi:hypothetical protein
MTEIIMALLVLLRRNGLDKYYDFLRKGIRKLSLRIMDLEIGERVSANCYERRCASSAPTQPEW